VDQFQDSQLLLGWADRTRKPACLHLEGKRKGLRIRNLVRRVPGTRAPRGPISRFPAVAWVGRPYLKASVLPPRGKTKRPTYTKLGRKGPWDTSTPGPVTRSRGQRLRSRRLIALFAKKPITSLPVVRST